MPTFRDLFLDHVGASLERQLDLGDRIGPCDWHLDMEKGTLSFDTPGEALVVPIQVLGSEADASLMWIAAWSIDPKRMAPALAESSRKVKAIGEKEKVPELANGRVPLDEVDGEKYSLVASALLAAPGYYRAPFAGGAMFILLNDPKLATKVERPAARMAEVFPRVTELLSPSEQKRAFAAYAKHHGGKLTDQGSALKVEWKSETLTAKVDKDGTVYSLDAA
jgi:hypothetical protein